MDDFLLELRDLSVHYSNGTKRLKAVDGVSFGLRGGSILALVGESGCGKTSIALSILGLLPDQGNLAGGDVLFDGRSLGSMSPADVRRLRGREISMIFQDPASGLNPVLTIGKQVEEIVRVHTAAPKREARRLAQEALRRVGLANPEELEKRYPYQLSGGMSQRVLIAIATVLNPKVIIFFVTFLPQFVSANDPHAAGKMLFLGLTFMVINVPVCLDLPMTLNLSVVTPRAKAM